MSNLVSSAAAGIRRLLVESPTSLGARKRAARWDLALARFPGMEHMHVIDLGGTAETWRRAPVRPASVTVLNLHEPGESDETWLRPLLGDACSSRETLSNAGVNTNYDLVFSNSLIEHLGGHAQRAHFANEVHALAPHHWVQTPYRYFPIEPHWLFPGLQFLPLTVRARIAAHWPLAHSRPATPADAISEVQWTELIGLTELRAYFPDSEIVQERAIGLTKSIIAIR